MESNVPDIFRAECGTRAVLDLLADKWTVLVVAVLASGTCRYGELRRRIGGITPKVLTQILRRMERDGLLHRMVYAVVPPMVEYNLTPLGQTLIEPLTALCGWAAKHLREVEQARQTYDAK
jgi:DNA-binding HxlR family transcriptional regulator